MEDIDLLFDSKYTIDIVKPLPVPKYKPKRAKYQRILKAIGKAIGICTNIFCFPCGGSYVKIYPHERIVITRFGQYYKMRAEGLHYINPITDGFKIVDVRIKSMDLNEKNVFTMDNIPIDFIGVINYKIVDPVNALYSSKNIKKHIYQVVACKIFQNCRQHNLEDILINKDYLVNSIASDSSMSLDAFGVVIPNIIINDINIPEAISNALYNKTKIEKRLELDILQAKKFIEIAEIYDESKHKTTAFKLLEYSKLNNINNQN